MKNYKEEVKTIRNGWIRSKIKMIEEAIEYLKPWDYVICKDGKPRIGRNLVAHLSLENFVVPEIIGYFREKGFIIEVKADNAIIYLEYNMLKKGTLYQKVINNLARYAYSDWPSNWPKAVNAMLIQKGIKVYNKPEDIKILYEFIKTEAFEKILCKIQRMTELTIFNTNGSAKINQMTDSDKTVENFFLKQGFDLKNAKKTLIMPLENKEQNGIIKYCYEEIYDNIASWLISRMNNGPVRKAEYICIEIHELIPKEVEDMLKSDGFVIRYKPDYTLRISLL